MKWRNPLISYGSLHNGYCCTTKRQFLGKIIIFKTFKIKYYRYYSIAFASHIIERYYIVMNNY